MQRVHIIIAGQVIGVGFREYTKKVAENLHLNGFVRNIDFRVEVVLEGSVFALERAISLLKKGSASAKITNFDVNYSKAINEFSNFSIREA